ncbi:MULTISPECIES: hypothetical protein [Streptomyces]|uniref:hypothetical protein n=1 Tax=Streptomyces TaxID=1883 RepID=UPI0005BA57B1|nr:hypothetical protein [Streptomyces sp. NRRL F-5193]
MDTRDFVGLVGRRAALRYLLAGAAAATLAACSGNGSTSVKGQTLGAFLNGRWYFEAENGSQAQIDVSQDGAWLVTGRDPGDAWSEEGTWSVDGGGLTVGSPERTTPYLVHSLPDDAAKALQGDYTLTGGLIDGGGQEEGYAKMRVTGDKDKVVLTFPAYDDGAPRVITCTRGTAPEAP